MKLRKLLNILNSDTAEIQIYCQNKEGKIITRDENGDPAPDFVGEFYDIPWVYAEMQLYPDKNDEPVYIWTRDDGKTIMEITLLA